MSVLTDNTHTIPELRDILTAKLQESDGAAWEVRQYYGTTAAGLLEAMLATQLPAAVVYWRGEVANLEPKRPQRTYNELHVALLAEDASAQDGSDAVQAMLDSVKNLMDNYVSGNTLWRYMGAEPVDLSKETQGPNLSCVDVRLEVGDH